MTARSRQIIIGTFVVLIIAVALYGIFLYVVRPADPTCFDDILNQREEGPDCGGPCTVSCEEKYPKPITLKTQKIIPSKENTFDVVLALENENQFMGALDIEFELNLLDSQGNLIAQKHGTTYAWPNEERVLVEGAIIAPTLSAVEARVTRMQWKKFERNTKSPTFPVSVEYLGPLGPGQIGFFEVNGVLTNEELRGYPSLDVSLVLFNEQNEIISANSTRLNAITALEKRFFRVVWFNPFAGTARRAQFFISVNPAHAAL